MFCGSDVGPGTARWRLNAGIASVTRTPTDAITEITGWRSTGLRMRAQRPLSPAFHGIFEMIGRAPLSTRSPSQASMAGNTVSDPTTATATTMMVPVAKDSKVGAPAGYIPAIAIITVKPDTSTARPDVAAAAEKAE